MNVLMVCPEFPPNAIGGGGAVFEALARHVPRNGLRLEVACANYRGGSATMHEGAARVSEIPLVPTPSFAPYLRTTLPPTPAGLNRLRLLLNRRFDVAHLHGVSFALVDVAARMLARRKIPWLFTLHGAPRTPQRLPRPLRTAFDAYFRAFSDFTIRRAAMRTSVSAAAREFPAVAEAMREARVIPNGVNVEEYGADRPERAVPGWPSGRTVFLSIGRVEPAKGYDVAVKALAVMPERDVAYVVLGEDFGSGDALRRLAGALGVANRFFLLGHADLEQKRYALRRSAMVWAPSLNESFGIVALEAMAAGVPVLASAVEGLREIFTADLASLLVAPNDAAALAERSRALLAEGDRRSVPASRLQERARDFSWSAIADEYVRCYREILSLA